MNAEPLIDIRDVSFAYGSVRALRDVTLRVEPGAVGIVGNNGAGKSTLMRVLLGLVTPTSGGGTVLGCDVREHSSQLRGLVGYMPEAHAVVPMLKGVEFVALSGDLYGMPHRDAQRRAHEVLNYVGVGELRYRRLDEYSTGNLQRLKLAAALVHDPKLLLLDEPTNGLDPEGRIAMLRTIEDLIAETGKSVLYCTHLLTDIERVCEQIVVMHQGTVAQAGSIAALKQRSGSRYTLEWNGVRDGFVEALRAAGVDVDDARVPDAARREPRPPDDPVATTNANHDARHSLRVAVPAGWSTTRFFALAAQSEAVVVQLRPEQEDLEQLFFRVTRPNLPQSAIAAATNAGSVVHGN